MNFQVSQSSVIDKNVDDNGEEKHQNDNAESNEQEVERVLTEDYFYPENHQEVIYEDSIITKNTIQFYEQFGYDSSKRYNMHLLSDEHIIFAAGTTFHITNINTMEQKVYFSRDLGGIGSIAVHPSKKFFAVAEKGNRPNIYIYEYPSMKTYRILRKGTERSYTNICFTMDGETLASVGSANDYMLCIWDWKKENILLKSKAFSQEIYRISFSNYQNDVITSSGLGHLKFWKIAETFTGLKLKGYIAKFGQVEISDVVAAFEFPDGKVLSSTEYGSLLLWEGNLIKCVLGVSLEEKCHQKEIECIFRYQDYIVSGSQDGTIKFWNFQEIDQAEADDDGMLKLSPVFVLHLFTDKDKKTKSQIMHIARQQQDLFWIVQDRNGAIIKIENIFISENKQAQDLHENVAQATTQVDQHQSELQPQQEEEEAILQQQQQQQQQSQEVQITAAQFTQTILMEVNSGKIKGMEMSSVNNSCVSISEDSTVRMWDFIHKKEFYNRKFYAKGTCLVQVPFNVKNKGRAFVCGFSNGIIRVLVANAQAKGGFALLRAYKVHKSSVTHLQFTEEGDILCAAGANGDLFFLKFDASDLGNITPYCLFETQLGINCMNFNSKGSLLLVGTKDGTVHELNVPQIEHCDFTATYLSSHSGREYTIKMMEFQKPQRDQMDLEVLLKKKNIDEKEEEWPPAPVLCVTYYDATDSKILVAADGRYTGFLYVVNMSEERPLQAIKTVKSPATFLRFLQNNDLLAVGFDNGQCTLRHRYNDFEKALTLECHDQDYGRVSGIAFNYTQTAFITAGEDGMLMCYAIDHPHLIQQYKGSRMRDRDQFSYPDLATTEQALDTHASFAESVYNEAAVSNLEMDIIDDSIYSIQEAKLLQEEDLKRQLAENKKEQRKKEIAALQEQFQKLKQLNMSSDTFAQLTEEQMTVDPDYDSLLQNNIEEQIVELKREMEWDIQYAKHKTKKLRDFMMDELRVGRFAVRALRNPKIFIRTFKVKKMSTYLQERLREIYQQIEEEAQRQKLLNQNQSAKKLDEAAQNQNSQDAVQAAQPNLLQTSQSTAQQPQNQDGTNLNANQKAAVQDSTILDNYDEKTGKNKMSTAKFERMKLKHDQENIGRLIFEMEKTAPTEKSFDPDHQKQIHEALERIGDYKLKSGEDYVVPEHQRMNVKKQRKHMFMLEEFIFNTKMKYNQEVLRLKQRKILLLEQISQTNARVVQINRELGVEERLFTPSLDIESERPELLFEVNDTEVQNYEKTKKIEGPKGGAQKKGGMGEADATAVQSQQPQGGGGGDEQANQNNLQQGAGNAGDQFGADESTNQQQQSQTMLKAKTKKKEKSHQDANTKGQSKHRKGMRVQQSELEDEQRLINQTILNTEKARLLSQLDSNITAFDQEIVVYQNEKNIMESDMKIVQMKLITRFQELLILQDMEDHDNKLISNLQNNRKDKDELDEQQQTIVDKLGELNLTDINLDKQKQESYKSFKELVYPDDDIKREKVHEFYTKRFKKHKAKMKPDDGEGDGDNEEDNEDEENWDNSEDEEDENDVDKPDIGAIENDPKVKEVITNIVDLEDKLDMNKKTKTELEKQKTQVLHKLQEIDHILDGVEREIRDYQLEKLHKTNKLEVATFLKLSQIQNLDKTTGNNYAMPDTLHKSILFTETQLQKLTDRAKSLEREQKRSENEKNLLKKKKAILDKKNAQKLKKIAEQNKEYEEKHMLKFGDIFDLQLLEAFEPTKQVLEMRQKFKSEEKESIGKIETAKAKLMQTKKRLLEQKRENTKIINNICKLGQTQMTLNKKLDSTNKQIFKDDNEEKRGDLEREKWNLKELVKFLNKEIMDLKTEIGVFKRKGGHIYTMVTSNKKNIGYNEINKNLF